MKGDQILPYFPCLLSWCSITGTNHRYTKRSRIVWSSLHWMPWCWWKHHTTCEFHWTYEISNIITYCLICRFLLFPGCNTLLKGSTKVITQSQSIFCWNSEGQRPLGFILDLEKHKQMKENFWKYLKNGFLNQENFFLHFLFFSLILSISKWAIGSMESINWYFYG